MKKLFLAKIGSIFLLLTIISGCQPAVLPPATTQEPSIVPTAIESTSTIIPPTIAPTSTETLVPSPTSTFIALDNVTQTPMAKPTVGPYTLSVKNISQLSQLAWWGKGTLSTTAWSADGKLLAVGSSIGVYLYDAKTLKQVRFIYTGKDVTILAISPDSKKLAIGNERVQLWDIATGKSLGILEGSVRGWLTGLAFSPGGSWLAAIGVDGEPGDPPGRFFVWNTEDNQTIYTREMISCGHGSSFLFSPDGRTIVLKVCGFIELIKASNGETLKSFATEVNSIAFTADGKNLIAGTGENEISIIDIVDEKVVKTITAYGYGAMSLSPDGRTLAVFGVWNDSGDGYGTQLWDIESGQLLFLLENVGLSSFSPDGLKLATISNDGVQIWSSETGQMINAIDWESSVTSITFGQLAGNDEMPKLMLVAGNGKGQVKLIDPEIGLVIRTIDLSVLPILSIAVHPNGHVLAIGVSTDELASILLYDLNTDKLLKTIDVLDQPYGIGIWGLAFSLDGKAIGAKTSSFMQVDAWDIQSGENLPNPAEKIWFNAANIGGNIDGHLINLSLGDYDGYFVIHDSNTNKLLAESLDIEKTGICQNYENYSISFDYRYFVLGCDLWTLPIWDLSKQKLSFNLESHKPSVGDGFMANITDVSFSPFGYLLASSGYDDTIRFWNAKTGQLLLTLSDHTCMVADIAFSPDGRYLASISCDGTLRLWGISQ